MLVLSRRVNEKIIFPGIKTAVQIVSLKPGVVRLGIDAPAEVDVVREEIWGQNADRSGYGCLLERNAVEEQLRQLNHLLRNQLNTAGIGLDLVQRQLQAGMLAAAQKTVRTLQSEFASLPEKAEELGRDAGERQGGRRPKKALLAEDNQNERELFAGLLRIAGLDVETASDGDDVLSYLGNRGCPDVLLLDMRMPGRDGISTLEAIRQDPAYSRMKIFAVSGHEPGYFGLQGDNGGLQRWFRKPINPEEMIRELSKELAGQ